MASILQLIPVPTGWAKPDKRAELLADRNPLNVFSAFVDLIDHIEALEASNKALVAANTVLSAKLAAAEMAAANLARASAAPSPGANLC